MDKSTTFQLTQSEPYSKFGIGATILCVLSPVLLFGVSEILSWQPSDAFALSFIFGSLVLLIVISHFLGSKVIVSTNALGFHVQVLRAGWWMPSEGSFFEWKSMTSYDLKGDSKSRSITIYLETGQTLIFSNRNYLIFQAGDLLYFSDYLNYHFPPPKTNTWLDSILDKWTSS